MALEQITDHEARALARTRLQFRSSVEVLGVVSALAREVQALEDALISLRDNVRGLQDTVSDDVLNRLGDLVGAPVRGGLLFGDYFWFVSAQIIVNKSFGRLNDLIEVAGTVCQAAGFNAIDGFDGGTPSIFGTVGGDLVVVVETVDTADAIGARAADEVIRFLRLAASAGTRVILGWKTESTFFQLDQTAFDVTNSAFYNAIDRVQGS